MSKSKEQLQQENESLRKRVLELETAQEKSTRIEKKFAEHERRSLTWLEHSPVCTKIIDLDLNLQFMSRAGIEGLGIDDVTPLYGKPYPFDFFPEPFRNGMTEKLEQVKDNGAILTFEAQVVDVNGRKLWFLSTLIPMTDEEGQIENILVISADTTERNRVEEALLRTRHALESAPVAVGMSDPQGHHFYHNKAFSKLFEYENAQDLEAAGGGKVLCLDSQIGEQKFKNIMNGEPWVGEHRMVTKSGRVIPVYEYADSVKDEDGKIVGLIGIITDVSERNKADEERAHLQEQLNQAQKMESVGRLAGGVAHDFNNMLGAILGHADFILEEVDPKQPIYADLKQIVDAAERSADLTRQLLAFARRQTINPKVLDLNTTVGSMTKMLQRLIGEDIDLVWNPGVEICHVRVDPGQVDQVIVNLCVNARDAISDVGKVTIETQNVVLDDGDCAGKTEFTPGKYISLTVTDTGSGMTPETMNELFEPFFTTKEVGEGTGLGLSTVYGIVKQNNGFVDVSSELGNGSIFTIYLPQHTSKISVAPEENPGEPLEPGKETILLVEDELSILQLATKMLQKQGYSVVVARNPDEAISLARDHEGDIDLLITDVVMPEMNGLNLSKSILSSNPHTKCLFMSGYTADVMAEHGILDDDVNFLSKPFRQAALVAKVRDVLDSE